MSDSERIRIKAEEWPFVKMPSELLLCRATPDAAKLTYLALRFWSREHGSTFAAHGSVRSVVGVGRSTFYRHLRELEDAGWIRREQRQDGLTDVHVFNSRADPDCGTTPVPAAGPLLSHWRDHPRPAGGTHTEKLSTEKQATESTHPSGCLFGTETGAREEEKKPAPKTKAKPYTAAFEAFWAEARKAWARLGDPTGSKAEAAAAFRRSLETPEELLAHMREHVPRFEAHRRSRGKDTQIKHVCRWIKHRQWEEDLPAQSQPDPEAEADEWQRGALARHRETQRMLREQRGE